MQIQKYKKTELGEIPEEWKIVKLDEYVLVNLQYGANDSSISNTCMPRYVRITDIDDNGITKDNMYNSFENDKTIY